jgi:colanic acid biosynthesis protein WcaH
MRIDAPILPLDCSMQSGRGRSADAVPVALLSKDVFATVVANAPLVAIDLIVQNPQGAVLLGLRNNPPAKGYWFVPGGRIRKGESLDTAFARIAQDELGLPARRSEHSPAGVYEHFYDVNFNGAARASTHYVVLAYQIRIEPESVQPPHDQHSRFQWMQPDRILQHPDVHSYTKAYFLN